MARHLSGETEPVEPWAAEEFRELARLGRVPNRADRPFRVVPASDVLHWMRGDGRGTQPESYGSLVEPFASSVGSEGPAAPLMAQLAPAIIGLQVGSLVGSLSTWVVAPFDAGLPQEHPGPISIVVPNIETLVPSDSIDAKEIRLWIVTNEVAFRGLATPVDPRPCPSARHRLCRCGEDRSDDAQQSDGGRIRSRGDRAGNPGRRRARGLMGGEEAEAPRLELEAFSG